MAEKYKTTKNRRKRLLSVYALCVPALWFVFFAVYYYGYGVKKNHKYAFKLWDKGAKLGCPEAEYYLGLCYAKGIHVKVNILKSKRHLYNALEKGYGLAQTAISDFIG